ncbi:hypothetical protein DOK67_0000820 [Enterococcus sp. DIV0212c]|uniref:LPXTG cell wall anchor domain-containing protein n=1 Tax=Enterococcus sp. DIV0212c TaxID=2230867 RepID=UPI001A9AAB96|nr:LPXTG cell wall anchor domain-containing protein [Enterococcus sp. DIV0212c]
MKNKKVKWLQWLLICGYFIYLIGMNESHAAENSQVTVGFYEEKEKEAQKTHSFPKTGEDSPNKVLLISGISILLSITGMISYKILNNEERI